MKNRTRDLRLAAQCLNHLRHRVPRDITKLTTNKRCQSFSKPHLIMGEKLQQYRLDNLRSVSLSHLHFNQMITYFLSPWYLYLVED
jgi:hypothetical protein